MKMSTVVCVFILSFANSLLWAQTLEENSLFRAKSASEQKEIKGSVSLWTSYCNRYSAKATYNLEDFDNFGYLPVSCECVSGEHTAAGKERPEQLTAIDKRFFIKEGELCPESIIESIAREKKTRDYCTDEAIVLKRFFGKKKFEKFSAKELPEKAAKGDKETHGIVKPTSYTGTAQEILAANGVLYLDKHDASAYHLVNIKKGKLYLGDQLLDSSDALELGPHDSKPVSSKRAIYVISQDGKLYVSKYSFAGKFHHSSFLAGAPVISAGMMVVENGVIKSINDQSGHYLPAACNFKNGIRVLIEQGYTFAPMTSYTIYKQ